MEQSKYMSVRELVEAAINNGSKIGELVLLQQSMSMEIPAEKLFAEMDRRLTVMSESVIEGSKPGIRSQSGLTGGDAYKLLCQIQKGKTLCGGVIASAIEKALAVSEYNAAMGRIVASPTAGSCGILPAAILTMTESHGVSRHDAVMALFTAAAVGMVIANCATIAGAEGGCQAECGAASAMAAAAIVECMGGTPKQCEHAAAMALKNILGLVCDPVAGLVEIPCIKRNAGGVTGAFTAAEMALAGIESKIPCDEVILAMKRVGDSLPCALRETADGGLADTPTGRQLYEQVFGKRE